MEIAENSSLNEEEGKSSHYSNENNSENDKTRHSARDHVKKHKKNIQAKPAIRQRFIHINGQQLNTSSIGLERHPSWLELIFDLAVVISAQKLVHNFSALIDSGDTKIAPIIFVLKFMPILNIWSNVDGYLNRFGQMESLADTLLILFQFIILSCISVTIEVSNGADDTEKRTAMSEFAFGILISRIVFLLFDARVSVLVPEAMPYQGIIAIGHIVQAILWSIICIIASTGNDTSWILIYSLTGLANLFEFNRIYFYRFMISLYEYLGIAYTYIPLNVPLSAERFGLITVVAIGEVIAVIFGRDLQPETYGATIMAVIQGFLFKFAYFDVFDCTGEHSTKHALSVSKEHGIRYYQSHFFVVGAIISASMYLNTEDSSHRRLAAGGEEVITDHDDHHSEEKTIYRQLIFAFAVVTVLMSTHFIGTLHERFSFLKEIQIVPTFARSILYLLASLLMLLISGLKKFDDHLYLQGIIVLIFACCLSFEFLFSWVIVDYSLAETTQNSQDSSTDISREVSSQDLQNEKQDHMDKKDKKPNFRTLGLPCALFLGERLKLRNSDANYTSVEMNQNEKVNFDKKNVNNYEMQEVDDTLSI